MRKIINGKSYDTDTARLVGEWDNGLYGDLGYEAAELYRKRTGEYFLHGHGGPRTRYAVQEGPSTWTGGGAISPLTYEEAMEWSEANLPAADHEAEFGDVPEGSGSLTVTLHLSEAANAALSRMASMAGESRSAVVERLIEGAADRA